MLDLKREFHVLRASIESGYQNAQALNIIFKILEEQQKEIYSLQEERKRMTAAIRFIRSEQTK